MAAAAPLIRGTGSNSYIPGELDSHSWHQAWLNSSREGLEKRATRRRGRAGVVGRAGTTSLFDLRRQSPSAAAAEFVEHLWSVNWDLTGRPSHDSLVITFPAINITREWGTDAHGTASTCRPHSCTASSSGSSPSRSQDEAQ